MSAFLGMDTGLVRAHGQRLRRASSDVTELHAMIDATVGAAGWRGPDGVAFRNRWSNLATTRLSAVGDALSAMGDLALGEADQQDVVSVRDGIGTDHLQHPSTIPDAPTGDSRTGYLTDDAPWLPDWLENPLESGLSSLASWSSDLIGRGFDTGMEGLLAAGGFLGLSTEGVEQFRRDADHLGGILEGWATGEQVPTIAQLAAAGLVTTASGGVAGWEAATGRDTMLLDDRPGGIVHGIESRRDPSRSTDDLSDLIIGNDALRMAEHDGETPEARRPGGLGAGRIGIQEVHGTRSAEPVFIVQIPPTEGAGPAEFPAAYGGQGNSRDWGSNLRLVAGRHPAAMDDVRAAMEHAGVPPGSRVLFVGHSQGGIIAARLAADATFNNDSGAPGTYHITHSFSVGSPVQTALPAQGSTRVINVTHGPVGLDPRIVASLEGPALDLRYTGDPLAQLDLQGRQAGGGTLQSPTMHEVVLPGVIARASEGREGLENNHDSVIVDRPGAGYRPSVRNATHPVLTALEEDLSGIYIGDGTFIAASHVITVGRDELP